MKTTRFNLTKTLLVCVLPLLLAAANTENSVLYRYKDEQGNTVIGYSVPPKYASQGYEVITKDGRLIEVIERQLSAEELANLSDEEKAKRTVEADRQKQIERDESLLLRYSSVDDIEDAREREMRELNIRLSILRGTIAGLKGKMEAEQRRAANIERSGRSVPDAIMKNIAAIRMELQSVTESVDKRKAEIEVVRQAYQADIDRFTYITEVLGYRR